MEEFLSVGEVGVFRQPKAFVEAYPYSVFLMPGPGESVYDQQILVYYFPGMTEARLFAEQAVKDGHEGAVIADERLGKVVWPDHWVNILDWGRVVNSQIEEAQVGCLITFADPDDELESAA